MEWWAKLLLHGMDYVWLKIFHWPYSSLSIVQSKWFEIDLTSLVAWPLHSRGDVEAHRKQFKPRKGISLNNKNGECKSISNIEVSNNFWLVCQSFIFTLLAWSKPT